ncbi:MAG: pyruvate kinase [Limibacillus sp.]
MRRNRKAMIVATLGPASSDKKTIKALMQAGADVFRMNFSHGSHEDHKARIDTIRTLEKELDRPTSILADLQGPKLRVGKFEGGKVTLTKGKTLRLDLKAKEGSAELLPLPHKEIFAALSPGAPILLDDGNIRLEVVKCGEGYADAKVITGGPLSNNKGVNVPGVVMPISPITAKDRKDLKFALDAGVDWIALSFVQRPEDVAEARRLVAGRAPILIKIEKPQAIDRLQELVEIADAVMVARGDLGVELPPEDVPSRQKEIIEACRLAGKPVVVATQMLDSMVHAPAPTRAEASDVATAVYDGADAVMLSAESAAGDYPVLAVEMMDRIIQRTETSRFYRKIIDALHPEPEATAPDAISNAASQVAFTIGASAIVCYTTSGSTALRSGRERPSVPILTITSSLPTARRLAIAWGLHCVHTADVRSFSEMVQKAARVSAEEGFAKPGDKLVITAGVPFGTPGATNILRIARVEK